MAPPNRTRNTARSSSVLGGASPLSSGQNAQKFNPFIKTTKPDIIVRHDISDEQLDMLGSTKRDGWFEFMWAMFGGALGAMPSSASDIYHAYWKGDVQLSFYSLIEVLIFVISLFFAFFSLTIVHSRGKIAKTVINEIRDRQSASNSPTK